MPGCDLAISRATVFTNVNQYVLSLPFSFARSGSYCGVQRSHLQ